MQAAMTDQISTSHTPADAGVPASNSRQVFIKTYGCQMNVYDSVRMGDALASEGYVATDVLEDADLVLLNTCHIREKAADKVYSAEFASIIAKQVNDSEFRKLKTADVNI